jgi:hypothetical protein
MAWHILRTVCDGPFHPGCDIPGSRPTEAGKDLLACFDVESVRRGGDAINTRAAVRRSNNEQSS